MEILIENNSKIKLTQKFQSPGQAKTPGRKVGRPPKNNSCGLGSADSSAATAPLTTLQILSSTLPVTGNVTVPAELLQSMLEFFRQQPRH
jgi:hypothetical protein